jgi:hypothetical protein
MGLDFFAGFTINESFKDHLAIRIHPAIGAKMILERVQNTN